MANQVWKCKNWYLTSHMQKSHTGFHLDELLLMVLLRTAGIYNQAPDDLLRYSKCLFGSLQANLLIEL